MPKKNKIKVALLGASGSVGRQFVRLLADHPFFDLVIVTSSEDKVGKKLKEFSFPFSNPNTPDYFLPEAIQNLTLEKLDLTKLQDAKVSLIFSALPSEIAGPIEGELRKRGFPVFSNSSCYRLEKDVPIIIPEVNPDHFQIIKTQLKKYGGFIVTSSNCCVAGLVLGLKPLARWEIKRVSVTTFQSISGARREMLPAADIIGNLIPYIKDEEEKINHETAKILGRCLNDRIVPTNLVINASCVRVPTLYGHLLSVEVEFKTSPDLDDILNIFNQNSVFHHLSLPTAPLSPIIFRRESDRPQPAYDVWAGKPGRAKGMAVTVGRLRLHERYLRFFLLVNNLVRGAAGNCLLTAELAYKSGYLRL